MRLDKYFDYAAATPLLSEAKSALLPYMDEKFHNPSALYRAGRTNRLTLESARQAFASSIGAKPTEIIFTAGGTEANNIAIHGVMRQYPKAKMLVSAIEHESVLGPAKQYNFEEIAVTDKGLLNIDDLTTKLTDDIVLISVMYANNEVGSVQPLHDLVAQVAKVRSDRLKRNIKLPLFVHTDACQAGNYLDMQVARLGVDLLSVNAGKVYGPKQTGALYARGGTRLQPIIQGGGQEWNIRSGTENLGNIVAFIAAWQLIRADYRAERERVGDIRDKALNELEKIPNISVNGPRGQKRLANNIHITVAGYDNERLLMELDEIGFMVATGSACSASNDEPSHVLTAMGITDKDARASLRITLGRHSSEAATKELVKSIAGLVS